MRLLRHLDRPEFCEKCVLKTFCEIHRITTVPDIRLVQLQTPFLRILRKILRTPFFKEHILHKYLSVEKYSMIREPLLFRNS